MSHDTECPAAEPDNYPHRRAAIIRLAQRDILTAALGGIVTADAVSARTRKLAAEWHVHPSTLGHAMRDLHALRSDPSTL